MDLDEKRPFSPRPSAEDADEAMEGEDGLSEWAASNEGALSGCFCRDFGVSRRGEVLGDVEVDAIGA